MHTFTGGHGHSHSLDAMDVLVRKIISYVLELVTTVEPLYSGHHRDPENVSAIRRCPLRKGFL